MGYLQATAEPVGAHRMGEVTLVSKPD
jgi:hypothetical protein